MNSDAKGPGVAGLEEQKEIFDPHRVYAKGYYFKNMEMDFVFQWVLGSATTGGCEVGEVFYAAGRMDENDPLTWQREWYEMGIRKEKRAEKALAAGNRDTASACFLMASNYFRASITTRLPSDPNYAEITNRSYNCLAKGGALMTPQIEMFDVQYENTKLPCLLWPASSETMPEKTLLMVGGGECFLTDNFFYIGPQAHARGYNFVTMDIPGQGILPMDGQFYRKDSENSVGVVIDAICERTEIDMERLAVIGISFGGYFAPRAASADKRIKALVTNSSVIDNYEMYAAMPFSKATQEEIDNEWSEFKKRVMSNCTWRVGLDPEQITEQAEATRGFTYDPADIDCPVLNIVGEGEAANSEGGRQRKVYMDNVSSKIKTSILTPVDEGAAAHCTGENRTLMAQEVFDWLDKIF